MVLKIFQQLFLKGNNSMAIVDMLVDIVMAAEDEPDLIRFRSLYNKIQNAREELISEGYIDNEEENSEEPVEG